jgi:copper-binding protein NosD
MFLSRTTTKKWLNRLLFKLRPQFSSAGKAATDFAAIKPRLEAAPVQTQHGIPLFQHRVRAGCQSSQLGRLILVCMLAAPALGTTYYVSRSRGSDANDGRTTASAWQTIGRVNRQSLKPGDFVLFHRGEQWSETLRPETSGSAGAPISYGGYGAGARPVFTGSDAVPQSAWQKEGDNLYFLAGLAGKPDSAWQRDRRLKEVSGAAQPGHDPDWWWEGERLYMRSSTGPPPDIEIQMRETNIDNNEQSHIVYQELDLQHARQGLRLYAWSAGVRDITLQDSLVASQPRQERGAMSAGVYASVHTGHLSGIVIRRNTFVPYPHGQRHWGVYFVKGVSDFRIEDNVFGPAGEDAICVWHSFGGLIARNRGGGNGENTIDVKDSHDIRISENIAEDDYEYNLVIHSVDSYDRTNHILVEGNRCTRGGRGGHLTAGIALLFVQYVVVEGNSVEDPYREGIFVHDDDSRSGNQISGNQFRMAPENWALSVSLKDSPGTQVRKNRLLVR